MMKYIRYFKILFFIFLMPYAFHAQADSNIQTRFKTPQEKMAFANELSFYARPYTEPDKEPFEKFCQLDNAKAKKYLNNKIKQAIKDPISAYHYGALRAFAPCIDTSYVKSTQYLSFASRGGVTEASYLLGLLLLKSENNKIALRYFEDASENMHPQASYNYALLSSNSFKDISKETIEHIRRASMSGDLKAQHDEAIATLKLYLNGDIKINKNEFLRLQNILDTISVRSQISSLSSLAHENSELLKDLLADNRGKYKPMQNHQLVKSHHSQTEEQNTITNAKKAVNYEKLENQGVDNFNHYLDLSDVNLVGTTY